LAALAAIIVALPSLHNDFVEDDLWVLKDRLVLVSPPSVAAVPGEPDLPRGLRGPPGRPPVVPPLGLRLPLPPPTPLVPRAQHPVVRAGRGPARTPGDTARRTTGRAGHGPAVRRAPGPRRGGLERGRPCRAHGGDRLRDRPARRAAQRRSPGLAHRRA